MRRLAGAGALFIATSNYVRHRLMERGFPSDRIVLLYAGIDLTQFPVEGAVDDGRTVLTVGRLVEKKGTEYLIRAFARLRRGNPSAHLAIVGDGPLRARLERIIDDLSLGSAVTLYGAQPTATVAQLMRTASIFCLPSVRASDGDAEGLGQVLLEAGATGKPLVGTNHGGIPEIVHEGDNGFLVPERDPDALADRLERLLADPTLRRRFGRAARVTIERNFNVRNQTAMLQELYRSVARAPADRDVRGRHLAGS
jgi:glycosyltransferase involved in cell wall biosynthesis